MGAGGQVCESEGVKEDAVTTTILEVDTFNNYCDLNSRNSVRWTDNMALFSVLLQESQQRTT